MNTLISFQFLEIDKVHPNTLNRLKELTIERYSAMRQIIDLRLPDEIYVLIAREKTGRIVGWATITHNNGYDFSGINVFVEFKKRRQGIGKSLFQEATRIIETMNRRADYFPWSDESERFFKAATKGINHKFRKAG